MAEIIGYQVARRQAVDGPWYTDWDGGILHPTLEEAQAAADEAQRVTGYPWEIRTRYDVEPEPGPVVPPQDV